MPLKKLKKVPKWHYPINVERSYVKSLTDILDDLQEQVKLNIIPNIPYWNAENENLKADSWTDDINGAVNNLFIGFSRDLDNFIKTELEKLAEMGNQFNHSEWRKIVKAVLGVDLFGNEPWLRDLIQGWVSNNTTLIKNLQNNTLNDITNILINGIQEGRKNTTIAKQLIQQTNLEALNLKPTDSKVSALAKAKKRAKFIAVDQVGKINGQLTERRQTDIGIQEYIWRNADDIRVRGRPDGLYPNSKYDHWKRDGKVYSWVDPDKQPPDGHPGWPIRCRCYAEANFSSIEGLEEIFNFSKAA